MPPSLQFIFLFAWACRALGRIFFHIYLWQLKEYRWDRYRAHLATRQGLVMLFHPWYWIGLALYIILVFLPSDDAWEPTSSLILPLLRSMSIYFIISGIFSVYACVVRTCRFPALTVRACMILVLAIVVLIIPVGEGYIELYLNHFSPFWILIPSLLATLILLPLFITLLVFLTSFPANYFKRRTIEKAKAKMASLPNLKVIGITGSYGKSSTKEFLATILSTKYKVAKTPANRNSEIGVAQTVLQVFSPHRNPTQLPNPHLLPLSVRGSERRLQEGEEGLSAPEVFIVEMGAYRKGEIKAICDIVHPTIGVLTAVSEQHLALFGLLEETKKAKYELIEALPENGVAIFNADNRATRELAEQTLKPKKLYSTERPADIFATAITVQPEKISFDLITETRSLDSRERVSPYRIEANLLGAHLVSNLLAAITVAHTLGMTLEEIAEAIKKITPLDHTLKPYNHPSGALVIDDSYSANPDGVLAALNHLKLIPRKYKVFVMMPMIELGSAGKDAHRKIGERIGEVCDFVIMTQKNFFNVVRKSSKLPDEKILFLSRPQSILNALTPYMNENSVILFENRIPTLITKALTSYE